MRWIIEISKTVSKQDEEGNWDNCHQDFGIISTEEYGSMREVVSYLRDRNVWYKEFGEYSYSIRENQDADDDELGDFLADYEIRIYRKDQIMIDIMMDKREMYPINRPTCQGMSSDCENCSYCLGDEEL